MTDPNDKSPDGMQGSYWNARFQGLLHIGAGNRMAASVIAGLLIGYGVDRWLGTLPIFMLAVGALGFVGGLMNARRALLIGDREDSDRS
jgi:ATP synthase protein I